METKVIRKVVTEVATERKAVDLTALANVINEFVTTRDMLNTLAKSNKALEAQIKEALGDAEVGLVNEALRIEVSKRERKGIDNKALAEAFPEAFEACQTKTEFTVLVVK